MTTAFLSPPSLTSRWASPFLQIRGRRGVQIRKCWSRMSSASLLPICKAVPLRRDVVLLGCCSAMAIIFPSSGLHAGVELDEDVKMALLVDDINAYSFMYPAELPSKKFFFKWVESRKPERYSSAAPLSPDARQRIVSERVDMINNLVISVSVTLKLDLLICAIWLQLTRNHGKQGM